MSLTIPCFVNFPDIIPPLSVTFFLSSMWAHVGNLTVSITLAVASLLLTIKYWKTTIRGEIYYKRYPIKRNSEQESSCLKITTPGKISIKLKSPEDFL